MPDRRRFRRLVAALGALLVVGAVVAPAAFAADPPWTGTKYTVAPNPIVTSTTSLAGTFVHESRPVSAVTISIGRPGAEEGDFDPAIDDECVPADPQPVVQDTDPDTEHYQFRVDEIVWPCNGRFMIRSTGRTTPSGLSQQRDVHDLDLVVTVRIPPKPVSDVDAEAAGDPDAETGATEDDPETVTVTWEPLDEGDIVEGQGYRVQRAGPGGDAGFATVSEVISEEDAGSYTDTVTEPGDYRYRVQSLRTGPDGPDGAPVPSANADTPTAEVEVAGPPTPPTTTPGVTTPPTTQPLELPSVGPGTDNPRATPPTISVPSPPTTLDTGFNDELDYGDRDIPEPGEELAGEGQSVIETEAEGAGLLGPVAGAMVLLGWAGHVAYLNRLAKQF